MKTNEGKKEISPSEGGCWFCFKDHNPMVLDFEFDTNVHLDCLREALKNPEDEEAKIWRLLFSSGFFK